MEEVTCWDWLSLGEEENFMVNFMSQLMVHFAVVLKKNVQYDWWCCIPLPPAALQLTAKVPLARCTTAGSVLAPLTGSPLKSDWSSGNSHVDVSQATRKVHTVQNCCKLLLIGCQMMPLYFQCHRPKSLKSCREILHSLSITFAFPLSQNRDCFC